MSIINKKIHELRKHISALDEDDAYLYSDKYEKIVEHAQEIVKLASFLKDYRELDKERLRDVKEVAMNDLNKRNDYDSALLKTYESCFEDY